jgi:hypothetical protein
MENQADKDPILWQQAKESLRFKRKLMSYFVFSAFFWLIWYFTDRKTYGLVPWPAWAMLGWGIGLAFRYIRVYHSSDSAVKDEYERLKNRKG